MAKERNDIINDKYDEWISDSQRWRDELETQMADGGKDVVVRHSDVAFAFPSRAPHPYSFDFPRIDDKTLSEWAQERDWRVQLANDVTAEEDKHFPWVRFTKK